MYHEIRLTAPRPQVTIDGVAYDLDQFGMDDGRDADADAARRLLFQLGHGFMIHVYVIQAGATLSLGWFAHTFWTKDCAVAEIEPEEHGPPARVEADVELPVVFRTLEIGGGAERYAVEGARFRAAIEGGDQVLELELRLRHELQRARLRWSRAGGYAIEADGATARRLGPGDRVVFSDPA